MKLTLKSMSLPITCLILLIVIFLPTLNTNELGEIKAFALELGEISKLAAMLAVTVILSSLVPERIRDGLIFTRYKHVLPSSRIKSLLIKDHRFGRDFIAQNLPAIEAASSPEEEHQVWWGMYKSLRGEKEVKNRHLWYLSLRDAFSASLIISIYGISSELIPAIILLPGTWQYYMIATLVLMLSARQNGNRMATNVISASLNIT